MADLSNITKYAQGRNIDAIVDAEVNGGEIKDEQPQEVAAAPIKKNNYQRINEAMGKASDAVFGAAEKVFGSASEWPSLSPRSDAGDLLPGADQVASLGQDATETVRDGLGDAGKNMSDADIKNAFGADVVAQIGAGGFPHEEVAGIQEGFKDLGMDIVAALQTYVEACNSEPGSQICLCDEHGATVAQLDSDQVLAAAGLDRSAVDQARNGQDQEAAHEESAQAAEASMAMA